MRKKITPKIKIEILLTLKNDYFQVSNESELCKIFDIGIRLFEIFKSSTNIKIDRECKIELLQWMKQGFIQTDDSLLAKTVRHPTFLEIMIASSQVEKD